MRLEEKLRCVIARVTLDLLDYYLRRGLLVRVAGEGAMEDVADRIRRAVKEPIAR